MEDRYLFRGKRTDNGEWVEGYLSYPFCTEKGNESYYFYAKDSLGFFCRCVVDASTICQCTGLKDKNGKLIWENDVVTGWFDGKRITGYIMYGSNATFFIERKGLYGIHLDNSDDWLEVIGNIFDEGSENIGKGAEEN